MTQTTWGVLTRNKDAIYCFFFSSLSFSFWWEVGGEGVWVVDVVVVVVVVCVCVWRGGTS